ncbi:MAG: nicotinic acid mononucleotide adenylyltransferase, partial [Pseudomonadota bacterium]
MPRIKRRNFRKIIVLGGSFDPCHHGHIAISLQAKKCLQADYVWWVVTPKNPLKSAPTTQMTCRVARARAFVASHPIHVMMMQGQGIEYTHQMIATMQGRFAHCRFVWLMGADNWR